MYVSGSIKDLKYGFGKTLSPVKESSIRIYKIDTACLTGGGIPLGAILLCYYVHGLCLSTTHYTNLTLSDSGERGM